MLSYRWYINDPGDKEASVEPMRRQMELYRHELKAQTTAEAQHEIMRQILQISKEESWTIGISLPADGYGTVAKVSTTCRRRCGTRSVTRRRSRRIRRSTSSRAEVGGLWRPIVDC